MRRAPLSIILCYALFLCAASSIYAATITVDASTPMGEVNARIFGYNFDYRQDSYGLWDPSSRELKTSAQGVIEDAGFRPHAMLRFPGGNNAEIYHWRRGVGPKPDCEDSGNNRPMSATTDGGPTRNNLGTDELMKLVNDNWPNGDADVLLGVNWWGWNDPNAVPQGMTLQEYAALGAREAANWVEYCNGSVNDSVTRTCLVDGVSEEHTVLEWATHENWQPTRFENAQGDPSTDTTAQEALAADGRSWLSTASDAPDGYFAWLRRYFAQQRSESDPGPYNIKYWEIGNEVWKFSGASSTAYAAGVNAYSQAMKAKDGSIKVGAVMDDRVNLAEVPLGDWDTTVLDDSKDHIDFASCHLGTGGADVRYSLSIYGTRKQMDVQPYLRPIYLEANTDYIFRIRAKGTPCTSGSTSMPDYPQLAAWLSPADANCGISVAWPDCLCTQTWADMIPAPNVPKPMVAEYATDPRLFTLGSGLTGYYVQYPLNNPVQSYSRYWAGSEFPNGSSDYIFRANVGDYAGYYIPWVTIPNNPNSWHETCNDDPPPSNYACICCGDNGRRIDLQMFTYKPAGSGSETVIQLRTAEDQTEAVSAAVPKLANRMLALREHIVEELEKPGLEVGVTEFSYGWGVSADYGQLRSLKGALFVSDLLMEMLKQEYVAENGSRYPCVDFGGYWCTNGWFYHIAQPSGYKYDPLRGCKWDGSACATDSDADFLLSPIGQAFRLFGEHFGPTRLAATVGVDAAETDTFDNAAFGILPQATNTPYLNALASCGGPMIQWGDNAEYPSKYYVMVVNRNGGADLSSTVKLQGLPAPPSSINAYTLHYPTTATDGSQLDLQNDAVDTDRVTIHGPDAVSPAQFDVLQADYDLAYQFPKGSVTVLEITLGNPPSTYVSTTDVARLPNGRALQVQNKYVTAVFGDRFYVQDAEVPAGIGVTWKPGTSVNVSRDQQLAVKGVVKTLDGEKVLGDVTVMTGGDPNGILSHGVPNKWLGGASPTPWVPALKDGIGTYNIGLLVNTWGRVTAIDSSSIPTFFYLDDGSNLNDGSGYTGIRVIRPTSMSMPTLGDYIWVAGISGAIQPATGQPIRVLRMRASNYTEWDEISVWTPQQPYGWKQDYGLATIVDEWNSLAISAIPNPSNPESIVCAGPLWDPIDLQGNLYRYDWEAQTWIPYDFCSSAVFGNCSLGDVLMLNREPGHVNGSIDYTGSSPEWNGSYAWNQWVSLPTPGQLFVANPFPKSVLWADCRFTDGVEVKTPAQAYASGWINSNLTGTLQPHTAYEIITNRTGLALIVRDPD